jgi:hypothetical protein
MANIGGITLHWDTLGNQGLKDKIAVVGKLLYLRAPRIESIKPLPRSE